MSRLHYVVGVGPCSSARSDMEKLDSMAETGDMVGTDNVLGPSVKASLWCEITRCFGRTRWLALRGDTTGPGGVSSPGDVA